MSLNLIPAIDVSRSALTAERTRLDTIASNIANANTTKGIDGNPYRRKLVLFESYLPPVTPGEAAPTVMPQVRAAQVMEDPKPLPKIYQPGHPHADAEGMVTMPNVEVMDEMVDMITASRSYEANLQVVSTARQMFASSMKIAS